MMASSRWIAKNGNRIGFPAAIMAYWVLVFCLADDIVLELINSIHITIGLAVIYVYTPVMWRDIFIRGLPMGPIHHLALGITFTWLSIVVSRGYSSLFRLTANHDLLYNYAWLGFFSWLGIIGGVLHITAPKKIKTVVIETREWLPIVIAFTSGSLLTVVLFIIKPHVLLWVQGLS